MFKYFIGSLLAVVLAPIALVLLCALIKSCRRSRCPRCKKGRLRMIDGHIVYHGEHRGCASVSFYVCKSCSAYLHGCEDEWSDLTELERECIPAKEARDRMGRALKELVAPRMRERGFQGSLRRRPDRVDIIEFEISSLPSPALRPAVPDEEANYAASLAQALADAYRFRVLLTQSLVPCGGRAVSSDEKRLWHLEHHKRGRLPRTSSWFSFKDAKTDQDFSRIAESVLPLLERVEAMFEDFENIEKLELPGGTLAGSAGA